MRRRTTLALSIVALVLASFTGSGVAAAPPDGGRAGGAPKFDVAAATAAYLAKVPPDKKARSDAYFEGGYWLLLWDFLWGAAALWLVLRLGWSKGMRNRADRLAGTFGGRLRWLGTFYYWAQLLAVTTLLGSPLAIYEGYFREHKYGLANQTFGPWLGDQGILFVVNLILYGLLLSVLYAVIRRSRVWWAWGSLVTTFFLAFTALIAPVFIFPLLNTFTKLQDQAIRGPILSLARANGIAVDDVYVMDASRQTTRISANVSGLLGTTRITLNDNLLKRCKLPEIEAVMGHEMGHYVLHHNYKGVLWLGLLATLGFLFLNYTFAPALRRFGAGWGVKGIADTAGLPLLLILFSLYGFVMTPVINSITRIEEAEADLFGLNASRQPDGAAEVALKLGDYRKLEPGPLEEMIFFDHPSGHSRIEMAMRYKAENAPASGPASR